MKQKHTPQPAPRPTKADRDNHANQLNSQHHAYWQSRGLPEKPEGDQAQAPPPPPKKP